MPLYRPSELRAFLDSIGISAKKRLSQNFLVDGNILKQVLRHATIQKDTAVVEVGPGPGVFTEALLQKEVSVYAVEKDPCFAQSLQRFSSPLLHLIEGDILSIPLSNLPEEYQIISNLPYQITTPFLERFLPLFPKVKKITLLLQKEAGYRLLAPPGNPQYTYSTFFAQCFAHIEMHATISRSSFFPAPHVDACLLSLYPKSNPHYPQEFFSLTQTLFQHKRKSIRSILHKYYSLPQIPHSPLLQARPASLPPEKLFQVFCLLPPLQPSQENQKQQNKNRQ